MAESKGGYWSDYKQFHSKLAELRSIHSKDEDERKHWETYKKHHADIADLHELSKKVFDPQARAIAGARTGTEYLR